jgi:hypothetical protein
MPTRILRVGRQADDPIRLQANPPGSKGQYAALSHCWGANQTFTLTQQSMDALIKGVALSDLPLTFRDAVTVSRTLGLQYLWIDSLCIFQGDPEDWRTESVKMRAVYSNATIVIAASNAESDEAGFLNRHVSGEIIGILDDARHAPRPSFYLQRPEYPLYPPGAPLLSEPLSFRAWALQERYLARRSLSFGSQQMLWECKTLLLSEDGRHKDEARYRIEHLIPHELSNDSSSISWASPEELRRYYNWYTVVEKYMRCDITFHSDRLPAISGLAERLWEETQDIYMAGLWRRGLIIGLLWRRWVQY